MDNKKEAAVFHSSLQPKARSKDRLNILLRHKMSSGLGVHTTTETMLFRSQKPQSSFDTVTKSSGLIPSLDPLLDS